MVDVSMPVLTGHTLNLTSKLFQRLGLKKLDDLFELKLKRGVMSMSLKKYLEEEERLSDPNITEKEKAKILYSRMRRESRGYLIDDFIFILFVVFIIYVFLG